MVVNRRWEGRKIAILHGGRRNRCYLGNPPANAVPFVISKEESLVFLDRAPDGNSVLISPVLWNRSWAVEEVFSVKRTVAKVLVEDAMIGVCTGLRGTFIWAPGLRPNSAE